MAAPHAAVVPSPAVDGTEPGSRRAGWRELLAVFGGVGLRGFGGPAVHVSLLRRAVVERRHWLDEGEFMALFAACNLIPGPGSTQLALLLGRRRAGWRGMLLAGALFILPAVLLMLGLAELYKRSPDDPAMRSALHGVEAAVVAVVGVAALELGGAAVRRPRHAVVAALALGLGLLHLHPIAVLGAGALLAVLLEAPTAGARALLVAAAAPAGGAATASMLSLALAFLKIGAVAFGSGYVLLAFLHADLVGTGFRLSDRQVGDAFAAAQATPGPVFAMAAFLGSLVRGVPGGLVAAAAIFAPSFVFVPLLDPLVRLVRRRPALRAALDGAAAAAIGLIAAVTVDLARTALTGAVPALIAAGALALLLRFRLAQAPAVLLGGLVGLLTGLS